MFKIFFKKSFLKNFFFLSFYLFFIFFFINFFNYYYSLNYYDVIYLFVLYFFVNIFFYFSTQYQISTFNNFQKNFWIRSFFLFWILEFFLFSIFLYLLLICPEKQYYGFEILNNHTFKKYNFINSNLNIYFLFTMIFLLNISIIMKTHNKEFVNIVFIFILLFSMIIFKNELKLFFSAIGVLTNLNYDYYYDNEFCFIKFKNLNIINNHTMHINELIDIIEYRPKTFMLCTIVFLKFFHIFFIIIFFIFSVLKYINQKKINYLKTSIILHNYIILFLFYILNWTMPIKYFFYFLIKLPYYNLFNHYNLNFFENYIILQEIYNFIYFLVL